VKNISKVSDVTYQDVADYLRLGELDLDDMNTLKTEISVAKSYISNYTGLESLDDYPDLVIVLLILCQDMWDNRALYVDKTNLNATVESILGLHARNLL